MGEPGDGEVDAAADTATEAAAGTATDAAADPATDAAAGTRGDAAASTPGDGRADVGGPDDTAEAAAGLWRNGDFMKLWGGETLSQVGTQITAVAMPLTAILTLHAGPGEVGLLATANYAPILVVSLFAGSWLDTHRRRPAMIAAHAGRAALLVLVPVLAGLGLLTLPLLVAIALCVGAMSAFFDVAYVTYVPQLVHRRQLVDANAKLEATYSVAAIGGPGLGGLLVQALTAPLAILADVASYLVAGALALRMRHAETPPSPGARTSPLPAIVKGAATTLRHPVLRPVVLQSACYNLFAPVIITLFLLYGVRVLGLSSGVLGLLLATGSAGGLVGTVLAGRIAARFGTGRTMAGSMLLCAVSTVLVPAAGGPTGVLVVLLVTGLVLRGLGLAVFNVHSLGVRAMVISSDTLGRVTATYRFISNGTLPLGGVLAGVLGAVFGVRDAMFIGVASLVACSIGFVFSGIRGFTAPDAATGTG